MIENWTISRERKAGLIFVGAGLLIIVLIALVLGTGFSRSLRYNVNFKAGKGIRVGDSVQLNGIDIGQVDAVELNRNGDQVNVRLKINSDQREKILADSTAYIADVTFPNVSGQKVVQIHNSTSPSGPMQPNSVIVGKDSLLELKAWQLSQRVEQWSEGMGQASKDLAKTAKQFTEGMKGAARSLSEGIREGMREDHNDRPDATPVPRPVKTPAPTEPPSSEGASTTGKKPFDSSTSDPKGDAPREFGDLVRSLNEFLNELGTKGRESFGDLMHKWQKLKTELGPLLQRLRESGSELLTRQLENIQQEIEKQLNRLRDGKEDVPSPDEQPIPASVPI